MTPSTRSSEPRKLPWTYWPFMLGVLLFCGVMASLIAVAIGVNPYVGFALGWGLMVLREVYVLKRKGY